MIRMQARSHALEENGQSEMAEISGMLVFYNLAFAVRVCKFAILVNTNETSSLWP